MNYRLLDQLKIRAYREFYDVHSELFKIDLQEYCRQARLYSENRVRELLREEIIKEE